MIPKSPARLSLFALLLILSPFHILGQSPNPIGDDDILDNIEEGEGYDLGLDDTFDCDPETGDCLGNVDMGDDAFDLDDFDLEAFEKNYDQYQDLTGSEGFGLLDFGTYRGE